MGNLWFDGEGGVALSSSLTFTAASRLKYFFNDDSYVGLLLTKFLQGSVPATGRWLNKNFFFSRGWTGGKMGRAKFVLKSGKEKLRRKFADC